MRYYYMFIEFTILVIFIGMASGCGVGYRGVDAADVTKAETFVITKKPGQGHIHSLKIRGIGNLDGEAEISLMLNGGHYRTEKISGKVDFEWGGDYYADQAEIIYNPISVKSGNLHLSYKFID